MAETRSPIQKRQFLWIVAAAIGVVVAITAVSYVMRARSAGGDEPEATDESISQLTLASTIEQLAEATGTEPWSDTELCVEYTGGAFEMACFQWGAEHPEHVRSFSFHHGTAHPDVEGLVGRLEVAFAHRLRPTTDGHQFSWARAWLHLDEEGTLLSAASNPTGGDDWTFQLELLWRICQAAIHDQVPEIDETTRRQWLGLGYPLTTLAAIDLGTAEDHAHREILDVIPASADLSTSDMHRAPREILVAVDHPWIADARFHWNEQAGPLAKVWLSPPLAHSLPADTARECLVSGLGLDASALDDTGTGRIDGLGIVGVYDAGLQITPDGARPSPVAWGSFLRALDRCGQEAAEASP